MQWGKRKQKMAVGIDFVDGSWEKFECYTIRFTRRNTVIFRGVYDAITEKYSSHEYPMKNIKKIKHTEEYL